MLINQIVAISVVATLLWALSRLLVIGVPVIESPIFVTVGDLLVLIVALVLAYLVVGLGTPVGVIFAGSMGGRTAAVASSAASKALWLVALGIIYFSLGKLGRSALAIPFGADQAPTVYDAAFLFLGLVTVYLLAKTLSDLL